jgi:RNA polymerase sigma-70 factor (ECF subfamily)
MNSTATLLERLRRPGDADAWVRFVELYTPLLYFWALRVGLRGQDAEDLVQDVFVTLVRKLPEFRPEPGGSFRAWLRTVAVNRYRDALRRKAAVPAAAGGQDLDEVPEPQAASGLWEAEYRQHVVGRAVQIMHSDFEPATWQACWAVVVEGKAPAQVATELGLTVAAVYAARARVLRRLRQELADLLE